MASERQIEANRRNAARSTGPRTEAGKAASRGNALRHGLAGESGLVVDPSRAEAVALRRELWVCEIQPATEIAGYELDRAVAASFRAEDCEAAFEGLVDAHRHRADFNWEQDRRSEAADLFERIAKRPTQVARRLETTRYGSELLLETWQGLVEALTARGDWTEAERSIALDLLGVHPKLRTGRTMLDPPHEGDRAVHLGELAHRETDRLQSRIRDELQELDDFDRLQARTVAGVVLTRPAQLLHRYYREAVGQFRRSLTMARELAGPGPDRVDDAITSAPATALSESESEAWFTPFAPLRAPEPDPEPTSEPGPTQAEIDWASQRLRNAWGLEERHQRVVELADLVIDRALARGETPPVDAIESREIALGYLAEMHQADPAPPAEAAR